MEPAAVALCFLLRDTPEALRSCWGQKDRVWPGKMVGLGGHVEAGETDAEAACREVHEEAGITGPARRPDATPALCSSSFPQARMEHVHALFTARRWTGEPCESDEIAAGMVQDSGATCGAHVAGRRPLAAGGAGRLGTVNIVVTLDDGQ